jgi:tetratricopeptide (TPR) repeat protein
VLGDALHMYAVALREFKHLEEAVIAAREALCLFDSTARSSEHPYQTARCLQTLGTILSDKGDHVQALPAFQKAVELFDEYQESGTAFMLALALNNTGLCARKCGLHDLAISGYQRCIHIRESIVAVQPDDWNTKDQIAGTLGNLSSVLCDMGRKGEALEAIDKAVSYRSKLCQANAEPELRVSLAKARHNRASVLFQMEQWGEAVNEYGHVVETVMPLLELEGRNDLRLLVKAATSSQDSAFRRIEERSMEEADALYTDIVPDERRAMAQCPGQWRGIILSRLLSNWAGLKRALDQSGAAWLLLEEAIGVVEKSDQRIQLSEMTDGLVMFYRNLGALLIGIHAFIKAEEVCAKGREYCVEFGRVGKDTTFTENYCTLSLCLAHAMAAQGKTEQGATILNELNELVLELDDSMKCRISLLRAINDAHSNLKGLVLSGADPQLYFHSQRIAVEAQSQRQAGDFIGAARLYEKALELNQNDEALWINLSVIYAKMKRHQSAMRCCDRAARLNPGNGDTWLNRGLMLFEQQHFADAAASFDKAYELGIADAAAKASYCRDIVQGRI